MRALFALSLLLAAGHFRGHGHHAVTLVVGQAEPLGLPYLPSKMSCEDEKVIGLSQDKEEVVATGQVIGRTTCQFVPPTAGDDIDHVRFVVIAKETAQD